MKWYKHDSNANMDAKLQSVILEYGAEGYGLYWYCLELIAANVDADNMTFELEHDAKIIARNLGMGAQRCEEIMKHMVSLGLFESSSGMITCMKLAKRTDDYTAKLVKSHLSQAIDSIGVRQTPTNSEKVQLDKNRLDKNRLDKNRTEHNKNTASAGSNEKPKIKTEAEFIFEHWATTLKHPRAKIDDKRKKLITKALKLGYTRDDLVKAITGCSLSPFHMGENDNGQVYDGLDLILRDGSKIDNFISIYHNPPRLRGKQSRVEAINNQAVDEFLNGSDPFATPDDDSIPGDFTKED